MREGAEIGRIRGYFKVDNTGQARQIKTFVVSTLPM